MKSEISNPAIKKEYAKIRKTALHLKKLFKNLSILIAKETAKKEQQRQRHNNKSIKKLSSLKNSKLAKKKLKENKKIRKIK